MIALELTCLGCGKLHTASPLLQNIFRDAGKLPTNIPRCGRCFREVMEARGIKDEVGCMKLLVEEVPHDVP